MLRRVHSIVMMLPICVFPSSLIVGASPQPRQRRALPSDVRLVADVEFARVGNEPVLLDLYLPREQSAPRPLVVWVHGGAWRGGDKANCPAVRLVSRGFVAASINYRLTPDAVFPAQIDDCRAAVRWLRRHSTEYGIDPTRVGVWGASAGGHLVALLGTAGDPPPAAAERLAAESARVQAVCDFFGPTDFLQMDAHALPNAPFKHDSPDSPESRLVGGAIQLHAARVAQANPITFVTPDDPPFLIVHGDQDPLVPLHQSQLLHDALRKAGVSSKLHVVVGAGHGVGGDEVDRMVDAFFDAHLRQRDDRTTRGNRAASEPQPPRADRARAVAPAELVVRNGKITTMNDAAPRAQAVAIQAGTFLAVGSDEQIQQRIGPSTRVIDAGGRCVVPGLIESHVHATGAARGEVVQAFQQLNSIAEIQDWLRRRVRETKPEQWIRLPRVDVTRIRERRLPTRQDLDTAAPDRPAVFNWQYADRQVQILNSAALRAAGITRDTKPPDRGKIQLGSDGQPTGVVEDSGALIAKFLTNTDVPESEYLASLERLLQQYSRVGITSIFERNSNVAGVRTYEKLRAQERLPVRVTVTIGLGSDGTVESTERAIRALPFQHGDGDDWVRVGPLKIGVDGGVLYGTAFLRQPYGPGAFTLYGISDPAYRGSLRIGADSLKNIIRTGHRLGWQMSSHVTGDAGVDAVLDAVEAANADSPIRDRRYTLIHAYFPNAETAARAARLGVCVDTQPAWFFKDGDALADALGESRVEPFIGLKLWQAAGVKVALNSDHMQGFDPVTSLNPYHPFLTMAAAISRKTESGRLIGPNQRVSREDALRMMTQDAAWLSFDESRKGSIATGKLADLAILSEDFMTCDENRIQNIRSVLTIVGGRIVHDGR